MKASLEYFSGMVMAKFVPTPVALAVIKTGIDPRRRFEPITKAWWFPAEQLVIQRLCNFFGMDPRGTVLRWARAEYPSGDPEKIAAFCRNLLPPDFVKREPPKQELTAGYQYLTQPFKHQGEGLAYLVEHDAWGMFWEQGLGKTKTMGDRIRFGLQRGQFIAGRPLLIFCPKNVVPVWPKELKTHAGQRAWALLGDKRKRLKTLEKACKEDDIPILVTNYEAIGSIGTDLLVLRPQMVVCDETHLQKRSTTRTSMGVRQIAASAKYRYALSGTPAPNSPLDIFGTLLFLNPQVAGTQSKVAFEASYAIRGKLTDKPMPDGRPDNRTAIVGYQNLDDLARRVATISTYLRKEDCLDLPPKVFQDRFCDLAGDQQEAYIRLREDAVAVLRTKQAEGILTVPNILTEQLRLLQVAGGFVPDDDGVKHTFKNNAKLELFGEIAEDVEGSCIVWCAFREELQAVMKLLADMGKSAVAFYGDTNDAERAVAIERFQGRKAEWFVGTAAAGGTGLTLTAAETMIYYSRTFNLVHYLQSQDRAHRIGQTKTLRIVKLRATNTVDDRVDEALERKEEMQASLLGEDVDVESFL